MQTRKDAALRKIVQDARLPIKTRRAGLNEMDSPSRLFLTKLANEDDVPAQLRLDAARRLPETERRMSEERARRSEPDEEAKRRKIDAILAECAREQGTSVEGPKPIPEFAATVAVEPQSPPPAVPQDEVSGALGQPAAVRIPDSPDDRPSKREEPLAQGRALAASVIVQYERFTRCPRNLQESRRLNDLQVAFLEWERQAHAQFPGIDTLKEFSDTRLRPGARVVDQSAYLRQRQMLAIDEQRIISGQTEQTKLPHRDGGFWDGAGPGI